MKDVASIVFFHYKPGIALVKPKRMKPRIVSTTTVVGVSSTTTMSPGARRRFSLPLPFRATDRDGDRDRVFLVRWSPNQTRTLSATDTVGPPASANASSSRRLSSVGSS